MAANPYISAIKQHLITKHHNDAEKLTSSDIQKIMTTHESSIKMTIKIANKSLRQYALEIKKKSYHKQNSI